MYPLLLVPLYVCYPGAPAPRPELLVTFPGGPGGNGVRGVDRVGVRGGWAGSPPGGRTGIARRAGLSTDELEDLGSCTVVRAQGSNHVPIILRKERTSIRKPHNGDTPCTRIR